MPSPPPRCGLHFFLYCEGAPTLLPNACGKGMLWSAPRHGKSRDDRTSCQARAWGEPPRREIPPAACLTTGGRRALLPVICFVPAAHTVPAVGHHSHRRHKKHGKPASRSISGKSTESTTPLSMLHQIFLQSVRSSAARAVECPSPRSWFKSYCASSSYFAIRCPLGIIANARCHGHISLQMHRLEM